MFVSDFGLAEFLVSFIVVALSLALPLGIFFLLYKIYRTLKDIEENLKKK